MPDIGPQYDKDDEFKAKARLHQSRYRANELQVDYDVYGNRLTESDARELLNYYDDLGVREQLKIRYPSFSKKRDGDMLRSEHIPFNLFGPLVRDSDLAQRVIKYAFGIQCSGSPQTKIEYAPAPKEHYLDDSTSFDAYMEFSDIGIGIEVKYTEQTYTIGVKESERVRDQQSLYWTVTRQSDLFIEDTLDESATDSLRQIWRNHLLGLAMVQKNEISNFYSITLFPSGNLHFFSAITKYQRYLVSAATDTVKACTYENFVSAIDGDDKVQQWKKYLRSRYIVDE